MFPLAEKIEKFSLIWGKITFDGSSLRDILFVNGKVTERDYAKIQGKYGTGHIVDAEEGTLLLKGNPSEIIIGTGHEGLLKLTPDAESMLKQKTSLTTLASPQAVELLNQILRKKEKVNALIHTTC